MKIIKSIQKKIKKFLNRIRFNEVADGEDFVPEGFVSVTYVNAKGKLVYSSNYKNKHGRIKGEVYAIDEWSEKIKENASVPKNITVLDFSIIQNQF